MEIPAWLAPYEPQMPLKSLVEEVNKIYHSFDAKRYDREHPEIHQQLPAIWAEMMAQLPARTRWRVLDFGCGTGFEGGQVLQKLGENVETFVAFDPSPEMLGKCKTNLQGFGRVTFCLELQQAAMAGPFNLLLTNSLLHHLPSIQETILSFLPALTPDAFWLAGHEPSSRFYRNSDCIRFLDDYSRYWERVKWFQPSSYVAKLNQLFANPLRATAKVAMQRGMFNRLPGSAVIDRIIDFHVPHSCAEVNQGRGLDFDQLQHWFRDIWELRWKRTYSYFGATSEARVPHHWKKKALSMSQAYPNDGANFCLVWERAR